MANVPRHTKSRMQAQPRSLEHEIEHTQLEPGQDVLRRRRPMPLPDEFPMRDAKDALMKRLEDYNKKVSPRVPRYVPREYQGE